MTRRANRETGMLTRRGMLKAMGIGAAAIAAPGVLRAAKTTAGKPNIVLIMADDMGYSDIGCYGGEIRTPNIDRLAARGIRFTQYHTENMCAPTRATLLTGRYWIRGFGGNDTGGRRVRAYAANPSQLRGACLRQVLLPHLFASLWRSLLANFGS